MKLLKEMEDNDVPLIVAIIICLIVGGLALLLISLLISAPLQVLTILFSIALIFFIGYWTLRGYFYLIDKYKKDRRNRG